MELYEATRDVFEKASADGFANGGLDVDKNQSFLKAWGRSVEVFSAFRMHKYSEMMASMLKDDEGNLRMFEEWRKATEPIQSHFNRSWLQTEYNTAVLRANQAADWRRFEEDLGHFAEPKVDAYVFRHTEGGALRVLEAGSYAARW